MEEFLRLLQNMSVNGGLLGSQTELSESVESTIISSLDMPLIEESHCQSCLRFPGLMVSRKTSGKLQI